MAKSRNNLLGVGGQRKKMSRADQFGPGPSREASRRAAQDQKQELLRKMRERSRGPQDDDAIESSDAANDSAVAEATESDPSEA